MKSYLQGFSSNEESAFLRLTSEEEFSVYYHNIFDYPLSFSELIKWKAGNAPNLKVIVDYKNGHYFLKGREGLIYKRVLRKRISQKKRTIALKASKILSVLSAVKMIGITGSLAMSNAKKDSDIDLIIITKSGRLWSTRLMAYLLFKLANISVRKPGELNQKNKLCLNIWLDESNMTWPINERNVYTAHEILQIIPILNRGKIYEKFLYKNKWALKYWPNAQIIKKSLNSYKYTKPINLDFIDSIAYKLQYRYLKPKLTKEHVTFTKAVFHPRNLSEVTLKKILLTQKP